jgi:citrate lyase subunit beta / citryl-CoA lyase
MSNAGQPQVAKAPSGGSAAHAVTSVGASTSNAGQPQVAKAPSGGSAAHAVTSVGASHPRDVLLGSQAGRVVLPVCDHYSGVEERMKKTLALQAEMIDEFGACVFDATLDCEDGAPAGGEVDHANMVVVQVSTAQTAIKNIAIALPRIGVRVHAVDHAAFATDVDIIVRGAGAHLAYIMVPKVESLADVQRAIEAIDVAGGAHIPLHVLIESSAAVHQVFTIAAHPRVESISFGLMDFVSSHGGAIPSEAMGSAGQFSHPLVLRAKTEIAAACHAFGKVPSHCVVTEFTDTQALHQAAVQASRQLGYTRMWSIHPAQIRPIVAAFAPSEPEIDKASRIVEAAALAQWAPISHQGQLHDRASYRYYWQVIERAQRTGRALPPEMQKYFH